MAKESVDVMIEGGKATAAPPLGPALGPLKVNIGAVVAEINNKTKEMAGMQVPVKVTVDTETKAFSISIGTPPASALIKKEAGVEKGSGSPKADKVADLKMEQIIKIAKMKWDSLLGYDYKTKSRSIIGTCQSMGILVEGKDAQAVLKEIDEGKYDAKFKAGKTELSAAELKALEEEKKHLQQELEARKADLDKKAAAIMKEMEGKEKSMIKKKLEEAGIPEAMILKLVPQEKAATGGKGAAAPAGKAAPAKK